MPGGGAIGQTGATLWLARVVLVLSPSQTRVLHLWGSPRCINELFNHSWQIKVLCDAMADWTVHFFLEMTLTFLPIAADLFLLLIITWKRCRSVRLARVVLMANFLAAGVLSHLAARPSFLQTLTTCAVRAPRVTGTIILVRDNLFRG